VMIRAKQNGLIVQRGFGYVKNRKAHQTPANIWAKVGAQSSKAVKVRNDPRQGKLF
jgi:hypothetical protein